MAKLFTYKGRDITGSSITGNLTVDTIDEVITYLEKRKITITDIRETKADASATKSLFSASANFSLFGMFQAKVDTRDIMNFCRQLATLSEAGVPIVRAISQLSESVESKQMKNILSIVANDIVAGLNLEHALKKHPQAFSNIVVSIIGVGENTGYLKEALAQLSVYLESEMNNSRSLASATRYPLIVICSIVTALVFMSIFVIPKFSSMFSHFKLELPLPTLITMAISKFLLKYWGRLLLGCIGFFLGMKQLLKIDSVHCFWDKQQLSMPVFGSIKKRIMISQFAWTFCLVLRSGLPIVNGVVLVANATSNAYFKRQLLLISNALTHGEMFSSAIAASGLFTPIVIQMVQIGEESGKLDELITQIAKSYDAEVSYDMKHVSELIEPIMLIVVGGMVLLLALSIYLPMWNMVNAAGQR